MQRKKQLTLLKKFLKTFLVNIIVISLDLRTQINYSYGQEIKDYMVKET